MNCINLIGRLAQDPSTTYFESGTNVTKFALAVNRPPRNGERVADFFNCECWGKTAEVVTNYCKKGKQIAITGRIELETWLDKNTGEKRSKPVIQVERVELLSSGSGSSEERSVNLSDAADPAQTDEFDENF